LSYRSFEADWVEFPEVFAIASNSGEDVYNYIRIEFATAARWEVRMEPVSSWEIRRDELDTILVLDSTGKKEKKTGAGGVKIVTTGYRRNPTRRRNRLIQQLEPAEDIGLGWSDAEYDSMIDGYGHFVEAFPYDNIRSSVETAPEHEIVYVNYPSNLDESPNYQELATVGINLFASLEFSSLQQFSGFCKNGYEMYQLEVFLDSEVETLEETVGSSNYFPNWLYELMTSERVGPQPPVPPRLIDLDSFCQASAFCEGRQYYYDSVEGEPLNLLQWASDIAQAHLLKLVKIGGKYHLKQAFPVNPTGPLPIDGLFTNGNIVEESFKLESNDYQARQPFAVEVKWREESTDGENPLFARERVALVAETVHGIDIESLPVESLDLSAWCTNYRQAIDAACYLLRFRRLNDHRVSFDVTPDMLGAKLACGSVVKLAVDVINYDQAVQGFITEEGVLVTTRPDLAPKLPGEYPALIWERDFAPQEASVVIQESGAAAPPNSFFALASPNTSTRTYEISKISMSAEAVVSIEAFHRPTDESGLCLLGKNWTTYESDANWSIIF